MDAERRWFASRVRELDETDCWELLANHRVGRVAYCDTGGPVVLPVNYALHDDAIIIRLSPASAAADKLRGTFAAFEVDDHEDYNESGWSVLVRGHADYVDPSVVPIEHRPIPWAEGTRSVHVRITPHSVTGRRLLPS